MLVNVRKMAAEGGGVWGAAGRLEEGQQENSGRAPDWGWCARRKRPRINTELGTDLRPPSPVPFNSPPPLPQASYGVRRSRHYARGITVSQPPRQPPRPRNSRYTHNNVPYWALATYLLRTARNAT